MTLSQERNGGKSAFFFHNNSALQKKMLGLVVTTSVDDSPMASLTHALTTRYSPSSDAPQTPASHPHQNFSKEDHQALACSLIAERGLGFTYDDFNTDGKLRANWLMSKDFFWSPDKESKLEDGLKHGETTFCHEFESFYKNVPGCQVWKDLNHMCFDEPALDAYLAICCQRMGICFMHAGAALQHILHCKWTSIFNHKMLNLSQFIDMHMNNEELRKVLMIGGGGSLLAFLSWIIGIPSGKLMTVKLTRKSKSPFFESTATTVFRYFTKSNEPALILDFSWLRTILPQRKVQFLTMKWKRTSLSSMGKVKAMHMGLG